MYPNPQDVLPLPPRPSLEQYRKRAKDLVRACESGDPDAIRSWAANWIDALIALQENAATIWRRESIDRHISQVETFARSRLTAVKPGSHRGQTPGGCSLAAAQFVIARAHGFASWPKFAKHLESLARATSSVSAFEAAADAVVAGDTDALERLLREHPGLARARSTREHQATLLHYVSANGVENYRQQSPANAALVTKMLLDAGADVDAPADVYGGGSTTLGLVATSTPPEIAGVQRGVIDVLLAHGARMDQPAAAGNKHALVRGCLANGQHEAATYLASRGASLDLVGAAGIGHVDAVRSFFHHDGRLSAEVSPTDVSEALAYACGYGHRDVVEFLLDRGSDVDTPLRLYGEGHTGLHIASYHAHVELVKLLVRRGAKLDVKDDTWGTPPLIWALTGWNARAAEPPERFYEVVATLVAAGAIVKPEWLDDEKVREDAGMLAALGGRRAGP